MKTSLVSGACPSSITFDYTEIEMATYEILEEYVLSQQAAIDQGNSVVVEVRDVDTFERLTVRARIFTPNSDEEGKDTLVLRDLAENVAANDWSISIIEEVDSETANITPQSDYRKSAPDGA
jgi:hypothetical protein